MKDLAQIGSDVDALEDYEGDDCGDNKSALEALIRDFFRTFEKMVQECRDFYKGRGHDKRTCECSDFESSP